jgi:hypothetical protein
MFSKISLGKFGSFQTNALIGQPFGLTFQVVDNQGNIKPVRNRAIEDIGNYYKCTDVWRSSQLYIINSGDLFFFNLET